MSSALKGLSNDAADQAEIGAYEAKTTLPELLRKVQQGQRFTITNRGQPVAELIPFEAAHAASAMAAAQKMIHLMKRGQGRSTSSPTAEQIREWREEGRK